eukprot:14605-Heterococcus_DN1.PRE.2
MVLFIIAALNKSFTVPTTALVILDNMIILWSIYYALSRGLAEDTPLQRRQSACSSVVVYADKGMAELCSSTPRTAETRRSSLDSCGPVPPSGQGTLLHPNVDSLFLKQRGSFISSLTHIFYSAFLSESSFLTLRDTTIRGPRVYLCNARAVRIAVHKIRAKACKPHLALHSSLASGSRSLLVTVPDDMLDRTALFPLAVDEGPKAFQYVSLLLIIRLTGFYFWERYYKKKALMFAVALLASLLALSYSVMKLVYWFDGISAGLNCENVKCMHKPMCSTAGPTR